MKDLEKRLLEANALVCAKELYALGVINTEAYIKLLTKVMKNNNVYQFEHDRESK